MFTKFFRAGFIAVAASFLLASNAFAQSTILVVDTGRVLSESEVGKHIARQMEAMSSTEAANFKAKISPLESTSKRLNDRLKTAQTSGQQAMQTLSQDSAFVTQMQNFQKDQQKVALEERIATEELRRTQLKAIGKVEERLQTILQTLVQERNADVVLERSLVIYGDGADVTDTVIQRLNAQLRTVPVTRERLPRK